MWLLIILALALTPIALVVIVALRKEKAAPRVHALDLYTGKFYEDVEFGETAGKRVNSSETE